MKVNLKTTNDENAAETPTCHQRGQRTVNGIIGNTRRGIVVDKTLDPDSNNPVANKPVSTALAALAGQLEKGQVVFLDQLPESGEPHKIYVLTATNQRYWWNGSAFVKIVPTDIKDSATIKHTLAENKISLDLNETIKRKINAALQRPTGLTKTKLVGVGTKGQENIEIGDNLTLANGKLSATGGGGSLPSTITFDEDGNRTVGKNLNVDGKLRLKEIVNDFNSHGDLIKKGFIHDSGDIPTGVNNLMLSYAGRMFNNDHAYWGPIFSGGPYSDKVSAICAVDSFASQFDLSKRLYYHFIKLTSTNGVVIFSFEHHSKNPINTMAKLIKYLNTIHVCANGKIGESAVWGVGVENKKLVAITADSTIDLTEYTMTDTVGTRGDM